MKDKEKIKKLRVVIDMVNGFIREGALADPEIARIIPGIVEWIEEGIKEQNTAIAFVKDVHTEGATEFVDFPPHCEKGTREAELVDELKPYEKDAFVYEKNSTSAMYAPGFVADIDAMENLEEIEFTGCCSDICVPNTAIPLKNYLNQNNRNVRVIVKRNLIETFDAPNHRRDEWTAMSLKLMKQAGITIDGGY